MTASMRVGGMRVVQPQQWETRQQQLAQTLLLARGELAEVESEIEAKRAAVQRLEGRLMEIVEWRQYMSQPDEEEKPEAADED